MLPLLFSPLPVAGTHLGTHSAGVGQVGEAGGEGKVSSYQC